VQYPLARILPLNSGRCIHRSSLNYRTCGFHSWNHDGCCHWL
jgi:hypothetical protein